MFAGCGDNNSALHGKWIPTILLEDEDVWGIVIEFLSDGTLLYYSSSDGVLLDSGAWEIVEDNRIIFEFTQGGGDYPSAETEMFEYQVSGSTLTLIHSNGWLETYSRSE
jgi:hypothetical protein